MVWRKMRSAVRLPPEEAHEEHVGRHKLPRLIVRRGAFTQSISNWTATTM